MSGGINRPSFRPTASPVKTVAVDTNFTSLPMPVKPVAPQAPMAPRMPAPPARSNVDQLVSALSSLNPTLNRFMGQYFEEENKKDRLDAEMKFLQDNSPSSWSEAVKRDPTLVDRSPVFRQVYESRVARTAVQRRAGELIAKYHNDPISTSEDPSAIQGWLQQNMKDLLDLDASPAAREALIEEIQTVSHRFVQAHAEVARKNLFEKNATSVSSRVQTMFDNYRAMGPAVPYQTDDPVIAANLANGDPRAAMKAAFLNAISGGESAGKYNIRYDGAAGSLFELNGQHPRVKVRITKGPNTGLTSDAAGRYQFLSSTWDDIMGPDVPFTPENQDKAALKLAERDYKARTNRNLWDDIEKEGLSPRIQAALAGTWEALKGDRGRHLATYNASLQKYGGKPSGPGVQNAHVPEMVEEMQKVEYEARQQGMTPSQINALTTDAVVANAIANRDESILEVAMAPRPDGTPGPGMTIEGRKQIEDARHKIRTLKVHDQNEQAKLEKAAKEAREAEVTQRVAGAILQGMKPGPNGEPPTAPKVPVELLEAANAEDPELFKSLVTLQKNLDDVYKVEDPRAVADITARVYAGHAGQVDVIKAIETGILKNHVTIQQLLEFTGRRGNDNPLNDPGVGQIIQSIENIIGKKDSLAVLRDPTAAAQALAAFSGGMIKFKEANPTAGPTQIFQEARRLQAELIQLYAPNSKFGEKSAEAMQEKRGGGTGAVTTPTPSKPGEPSTKAPMIDPRPVEWRKVPVYDSPQTLDQEFKEFMQGNNESGFAKWLKANGLLGNPAGTAEFLQAQRKLLQQNKGK